MDTKLIKVDADTHKQAKIEAAVLGITLRALSTQALKFWRRLVAAGRDAIEGDIKPLQDVIDEIDRGTQ